MSTRKTLLVGALAGVIAVLVTLLGVHLWIDHQNLHGLVTIVQRQMEQQRAAQPAEAK